MEFRTKVQEEHVHLIWQSVPEQAYISAFDSSSSIPPPTQLHLLDQLPQNPVKEILLFYFLQLKSFNMDSKQNMYTSSSLKITWTF